MAAPAQSRVVTIDASDPIGAPKFRGETADVIHDHGNEKSTIYVSAPVNNGKASVHVDALTWKRATAVSDSDLINADSLVVDSITHDMGHQVLVGTIAKGDDSVINHGNRESLLVDNELISGHFISTASGAPINVKIPVSTETPEQREIINKQALSRAQHWHGDALKYQTGAPLDHDVRVVSNGLQSRVLIPTALTPQSSGTSRFFNLNRNSDGYFDGQYSGDNAKVVEFEGEPHYVLQGDHYKEMKTAFETNLSQKANVSTTDGFKIDLNAGGKGVKGTAYVKMHINRTPSASILKEADEFSGIDLPENNIITSTHLKIAAGDEIEESLRDTAHLSAEDVLNQQIFGDGTNAEEESGNGHETSFVPSSTLTVTSFDASEIGE